MQDTTLLSHSQSGMFYSSSSWTNSFKVFDLHYLLEELCVKTKKVNRLLKYKTETSLLPFAERKVEKHYPAMR